MLRGYIRRLQKYILAKRRKKAWAMRQAYRRYSYVLGKWLLGHGPPKKGTLLYLGANFGDSLSYIIRNYKRCYVFEPNPEIYEKLKARFARFSHVKCYQAAVGEKNGIVTLYTSNYRHGSASSLGHTFKQEFNSYIVLTDQIQVPCVYLPDFLQKEGIEYIDDYISDVQGMDYAVLATLTPWIQAQKIGAIQCEVTLNGKHNCYEGLPANDTKCFEELLRDKYALVARGLGWLTDGDMALDPTWWWADYRWRKLLAKA